MTSSNNNSAGKLHSIQPGQLDSRPGFQPRAVENVNANPSIETLPSWELLDRIIPRGKRKTIAYHMHVSEEWVSRWCREPRSGDNASTGSPIDRTTQLHDSIFLVNPLGAVWVPEYIANHHRQLVRAHEAVGFANSEQRRDTAAEILQRATATVNSLNLKTPTPETLRQVVELIEVATRAKEQIQDGLS